jgi:demethylmenaquinone methyltransferase/2-methoxy-6-polyprenyl-1,4-benzoquinol methylase
VSTLALMRLLESAPARYDLGIRLLTLGKIDQVRDTLAKAAVRSAGARVLEIGCGTGEVTEKLIARGARVTAVDQNPEMVERARARLAHSTSDSITFVERTASEIDAFPECSFDAVIASLSLSEMSHQERVFVLKCALRALRPGGVIAIADEVRSRSFINRALQTVVREPQAALGWLVVGSVSSPILNLAAELAAAGFVIRNERRWLLETLAVVIAERRP